MSFLSPVCFRRAVTRSEFTDVHMFQSTLPSIDERAEDQAMEKKRALIRLRLQQAQLAKQQANKKKKTEPAGARVIPVVVDGEALNIAPLLDVRVSSPYLHAAAHALSAMNRDHLRMYGRRLVLFPHGTIVTLTDLPPDRDVENAERYVAQALAVLQERWLMERRLLMAEEARQFPRKRVIGFEEALMAFVSVLRFRTGPFNGLANALTLGGAVSRILQPPLEHQTSIKVAAALHTRMFGARDSDARGTPADGAYVIFPGHTYVCLLPGRRKGEVLRDTREDVYFEQVVHYPTPLTDEEQTYCEPHLRMR